MHSALFGVLSLSICLRGSLAGSGVRRGFLEVTSVALRRNAAGEVVIVGDMTSKSYKGREAANQSSETIPHATHRQAFANNDDLADVEGVSFMQLGANMCRGSSCRALEAAIDDVGDSEGVSLVQRGAFGMRSRAMVNHSAQTHETLPKFCSDPKDKVWSLVCSHWKTCLSTGAIENGALICCGALPEACREAGETCSNEMSCMVPSCWQEDWYLQHLESGLDEYLQKKHESPRSCFFRTADLSSPRGRCGADDADVYQDPSKIAQVIRKTAAEEATEVKMVEAETGNATSLLSESTSSPAPWHDETIQRLEWRVLQQAPPWGQLGVLHSILFATTPAGTFQMEKERLAPYDVLLQIAEVEGGELHAAANGTDLRPGLTMAQILSRFPVHYDILRQNCHHAAAGVFEWAAPGMPFPELPNQNLMKMLHVGSDVVPGFEGFAKGILFKAEETFRPHSVPAA